MAKQDTFTLNIGARTTAGYDRTMRRIQSGFKSITGGLRLAGKLASISFAGTQIVDWGKDAVETYKTFESSMKNTAAIMDATVMEYEMLEDAARQAGRTTTKTAAEAADALGYMALAGWDAETSVEGLLPILRLAESTGKELQVTSDLVTDSMSALGISVDDLNTYMDKLVATNNNANTSAEQLMYALVKSGGSARVMGADLDDTITALGIFANNGLKSSEAGTALNSLLKRWGSNSQAIKAFNELNVELYDANDQFVGMESLLGQINDGMEGMNKADQNAYMSMLGGRFLSQLQYLLDSVKKTGDDTVSTWDSLQGKIENSNGALQVMNKTATSSLEASQKLMESAFQDLQISAVDIFADDFKDAMQYMARELPEISDRLAEFEEEHHDEIIQFLGTATEGIVNLANASISFGDWILDNGPAVEGILAGLFMGSIASRIGTFALDVAAGISAAGGLVAFLGGPATLAVAGIAGAVGLATGGIVALTESTKKAREEAELSSLAEHFGTIALNATDIEEAAYKILGTENMSRLNEFTSELSKVETALQGIDDSSLELSRLNWKIDAGISLNETDRDAYKEAADKLIRNTQEYIDGQGYSLSLAQSILGRDGTDTFSMDFWSYQSQQASKLGVKLNKAIEKAMKDGVIDPDKELPKIMKLQNALIKMQQEMENAKYNAEYQALEDNIDSLSFEEIIKRTGELNDEQASAMHDAYTTNLGSLNYQLSTGAISQYEYDQQKNALEKDYIKARNDSTDKVMSTLLGQIKDTYSEKLKGLTDGLNLDSYITSGVTPERMAGADSGSSADLQQVLVEAHARIEEFKSKLSGGDKDAINRLLEDMLPTKQQYDQIAQMCEEMGRAVPEKVVEGIQSYQQLKALTGSDTDIWDYVYSVASNNESYNMMITEFEEKGTAIPEKLASSISNNYTAIDTGIDNLYSHTQNYITRKFSTGFNATIDVRPTVRELDPLGLLPDVSKVARNARGGIYNSPLLTTFAENGPEAAIPINNKPRSVALWEKTGELMGVTGGSSINYSPQYIIQGNANKKDIVEAQEIGLSRFRALYNEMRRQDGRVAFAR